MADAISITGFLQNCKQKAAQNVKKLSLLIFNLPVHQKEVLFGSLRYGPGLKVPIVNDSGRSRAHGVPMTVRAETQTRIVAQPAKCKQTADPKVTSNQNGRKFKTYLG